MTREIKFRGKRVDNGEWIVGDLVHDAFDGTSKTLPVAIQQPKCYPVEVIPETVGQYTGLKDKNGKEIFEGDILKCYVRGTKLPAQGHVEYKPTSASFAINVGPQLIDNDNDFYAHFWTHENFEIIGNLHDNPELIN